MHMKRMVPLALVVLALAVTPVALAAGGNGGGSPQALQARIAQIAGRFEKVCGTSSAGAPQKCVDFANKALTRLQTLDTRVEQKMSGHPRLQQLDTVLKDLIGKLQTWLGSAAG
jgi:hypothetical protein